ncbi:MAG: homoserine kinase [Thermomicrobiales bacterium]
MRFSVRAPASSANLGPGFDALGLALDLWNEVEITVGETDAVALAGSGADLLGGRENLTLTAMRLLAARGRRPLPTIAMTLHAEIPVARGLGSSAAAIVAGLLAANRLLDLDMTSAELFAVAAEMEGHGDNVGAAIYGGAILAVPGMRDALRLSDGAALGLDAVLFVPEATGATWVARAQLPQLIPHADAAFNVGTASGLAVGLLTADREAIAAGMHDKLHEPHRARLFPHLLPMQDAARHAGAVGACLSGAGPSVLALADPADSPAVVAAFDLAAARNGVSGSTCILKPASTGAHLVDH